MSEDALREARAELVKVKGMLVDAKAKVRRQALLTKRVDKHVAGVEHRALLRPAQPGR